MNVESPHQFADFETVCKSLFASIAFLVDADLQLWEVKSPELIPASDICGLTVVINKAASPDVGGLYCKYVINVITGQRSFEVKALNSSDFCL